MKDRYTTTRTQISDLVAYAEAGFPIAFQILQVLDNANRKGMLTILDE